MTIVKRIEKSIRQATPKALKTAWWLIKITIPVSFAVMLLSYFGILNDIARFTSPIFNYLGLPGIAAIVFITSIFTNIYSAIAIMAMFSLPVRDATILASMCLISHGFIIETAVLTKTGSSPVRMLTLRLASSFILAFLLNRILPGSFSDIAHAGVSQMQTFGEALHHWFNSTFVTVLKIFILVNVLLVAQRIMEEFGWIKFIEAPLKPFMKVLGLPRNTTFSWIVANLIGLAYGSAIMIDQTEQGKMSREDADLLNHHIAVSHSQLEDTALFMTLGIPALWIIVPRFLFAIPVVWARRLERKFRNA